MKTEKEAAMRRLLAHLFFRNCGRPLTKAMIEDIEGREIIVTPFDGAYGCAGYVLTLNGSPPRGTIITIEGECDDKHGWRACSGHPYIYYCDAHGSRRLGVAQARVFREYVTGVLFSQWE